MPQHRTKSYLRKRARKLRAKAAQTLGEEGARGFLETVLKAWADISDADQGMDAILAGYYPMGDELDVRPAMVALDCLGVSQCLPEVIAKDSPLQFRSWIPHDPLVEGDHGTFHPLISEPILSPGILFVPMLAFDRRGYRLGWGGGYYDRTLELLRKSGSITAVGVAYGAQEIDEVPVNDYDQPVDWIITEQQAIKVS